MAQDEAVGEAAKGQPFFADNYEQDSDDHEIASQASGERQAGVKKIEAISLMWTTGGLIIAYVA